MRDMHLTADFLEDEDDRTVIVSHSEMSTIHGSENESVEVSFDVEADGIEFGIYQDGNTILLSLYEAAALRDVLDMRLEMVEL